MEAPSYVSLVHKPHWTIPPQIYYEQVKEGDQIPNVEFNLTVQRMIMFVGVTRNFPGLHHNDRVAQKQGAAPAMFLQNNSCLMLWERATSDWFGVYGRVRKATFRITDFHLAGENVTVGGTVHKKWQENGLNLVELVMESKNPRRVCMSGTVTVALPSLNYPTTTPMWDREGKATVVCQ